MNVAFYYTCKIYHRALWLSASTIDPKVVGSNLESVVHCEGKH